MARAHLIFGFVVFVVFLITGQFMEASFPEKNAISQEFRLLMRSRHIYILFSALLHLLLGVYFQTIDAKGWRRHLQTAGSAFLVVGSLLLVVAFFYETYSTSQFSELSRSGLYVTLAGAVFHVISRFALK